MSKWKYNEIWRCLNIDIDKWIGRMNQEFNKHKTITKIVCLDESMIPFKSRRNPHFIFVPRKPHPVGIKLFTAADSDTFIFKLLMKKRTEIHPQQPLLHRTKVEFNRNHYEMEEEVSVPETCLKLTNSLKCDKHIVVCDKWFGSLSTLCELKRVGIDTVMKTKDDRPKALWERLHQTAFHKDKTITNPKQRDPISKVRNVQETTNVPSNDPHQQKIVATEPFYYQQQEQSYENQSGNPWNNSPVNDGRNHLPTQLTTTSPTSTLASSIQSQNPLQTQNFVENSNIAQTPSLQISIASFTTTARNYPHNYHGGNGEENVQLFDDEYSLTQPSYKPKNSLEGNKQEKDFDELENPEYSIEEQYTQHSTYFPPAIAPEFSLGSNSDFGILKQIKQRNAQQPKPFINNTTFQPHDHVENNHSKGYPRQDVHNKHNTMNSLRKNPTQKQERKTQEEFSDLSINSLMHPMYQTKTMRDKILCFQTLQNWFIFFIMISLVVVGLWFPMQIVLISLTHIGDSTTTTAQSTSETLSVPHLNNYDEPDIGFTTEDNNNSANIRNQTTDQSPMPLIPNCCHIQQQCFSKFPHKPN